MSPTNGQDRDNPNYATPGDGGVTPNSTPTTGTTVAAWLPGGGGGGMPTIDGLRLFKPMDNELTGHNMNTGRHAWSLPVGPTLERITNHPLLAGIDIPDSGGVGFSVQMVMGDILVQTRSLSEGGIQNIPDAPLTLNARDKLTGEILGSVPLPAPGQYGMMTYMHEGKQYIVVQTGSSRTDDPAGLVALRLP
jgi:glucose dehydrogenase